MSGGNTSTIELIGNSRLPFINMSGDVFTYPWGSRNFLNEEGCATSDMTGCATERDRERLAECNDFSRQYVQEGRLSLSIFAPGRNVPARSDGRQCRRSFLRQCLVAEFQREVQPLCPKAGVGEIHTGASDTDECARKRIGDRWGL